jgi:GR25 family glycosyltransferase involved in LPS biosynthesis
MENIDKIFYINLKHREDRRNRIESELKERNILNFERFDAVQNKEFGILGCGQSHLGVLCLASYKDYENILILEDDFTFNVSGEEFQSLLKTFFDNYKNDFDVCMIAYNMFQAEKTNIANIGRVYEAQSAAGYIVNKRSYEKLINLYVEALPLLESTRMHWIYGNDQIWKKLQKTDKWYFIYPKVGRQIDGFSDISQCHNNNEWDLKDIK